jgi:hypothetical protein
MVRYEVELDVAYGQFYLWDPAMPFEPPVDWTEADVDGGLKAAPHLVAIAPFRDGSIALAFEMHDHAPTHELANWDHVVEASLEVVSGRLELQEWSGIRRWQFTVRPGWYQVRAMFGNLASIFVEDEPEADRYLAAVWPGCPAAVRVLKQFRLSL